MGIIWEHKKKEPAGYAELVSCYPEKEFNSPFRSTIPHLLFWRSAETRFPDFCRLIGAEPSPSARLSFEYQVIPPYGRGKASHTDLMLTWDNYCAAIEAKYTESEYDTVGKWLEKGNRENRLMVVKGWCKLLAENTGSDLTIDDVKKINYQLLHRAASACSFENRTQYLIYEVFQDEGARQEKVDYQGKIKELLSLLKPNSIYGFVMKIPIKSSAEYEELKNQWRNGSRHLSREVLMGLRSGRLMDFGEPEVIDINKAYDKKIIQFRETIDRSAIFKRRLS